MLRIKQYLIIENEKFLWNKKKEYKPKKTEIITKDEYEEVVVEDEHGNQFKRYREKVKRYFDDNWYKMEDSADKPEKFD